MTREEFQAAHGPAWAELTKHPAFFAAMQVVSASRLQRITALTHDEIRENAVAILADFHGHLVTENGLIELAVAASENVFDLPPETYRDPSASDGAQPAPDESEPTEFVHFRPPPTDKPKKKQKPKRK